MEELDSRPDAGIDDRTEARCGASSVRTRAEAVRRMSPTDEVIE
jgi:hypothetical protein